MADFCLPPAETNKVREAFKNGKLNPLSLRSMSSAERRSKLAEYVGDDMAKEVNARFESNLLLKNQKDALMKWAKNLAGITETRRKDLVDQIENLNRVLDPVSQKTFLADLAEQKLGASVSMAEAKELVKLASDAQVAKSALSRDPWNTDLQIAFGDAYQALTKRVAELKEPKWGIPRTWEEVGELGLNIAGLPKQFVANFDFSAPLVQNAAFISNKRFWQGMPEMLRYFADEANFTRLNSEVIGHPYYPLAQKAKLGITELDGRLLQREEAISSNILEKMVQYGIDKTGFEFLPNAPRAFNRAFTGYNTYVRWKTFVDFVEAGRMMGEDIKQGSKFVEDIANVINNFSGRASYPKGMEQSNFVTGFLNATFWAPRKVLAVAQTLNPIHYARLSPNARKIALKQLATWVGVTTAMWGLVKASGGEVELDPRSQAFGTVTLPGGKYRYDMTGGAAIMTRFLSRLITGQIKTLSGKVHNVGDQKLGGQYNRMDDILIPFVRSKLGPTPAIFADAMFGQNAVGEEFDLQQQIIDRTLIPMTIKTYTDMYNDEGKGASDLLVAPLVTLGLGVRMPFRAMEKGLNAFGEPDRLDTDKDTTLLYNSLRDIGKTPYPAPDTINGIKLTDEQHTAYISLSGMYLKQFLVPLVSSERWSEIPIEARVQIFNDNQRNARKLAADRIIAESIGTENDIMQKSLEKQFQGEN